MIQTKEEMFLAELGINPKKEIEGLYGAKIKIIDLLKKYQAEQLNLSGVGSSLPTKKYEIDFGTHLRCGIDVTNNELNILGAMDGWGNGVSKDVVVIKEL
jgi:hypothetical protein